jgi:integrase
MNDQNVLRRHIKPAAKALGLHVNRTSHATWLVQAGDDPKSVQGQMSHSHISTTIEIHAQIVPVANRNTEGNAKKCVGLAIACEADVKFVNWCG